MSATEQLKRYFLFLIGLFFNSFGVSFVTKANLGTSPISSIPYTLSLAYVPTLGEFTLYMSILLIILQLLLLRKNFPKQYFLQIPVSIVFSYFIDCTMSWLAWLDPHTYAMQVCSLILGCIILGIGVFLEMMADVVMLPGESFVKAISSTFKVDFGKTKVAFDSSMTVIAAIMGFILFHRLAGVREGTVIAALLVGMTARFLNQKLGMLQKYLVVTVPDFCNKTATVSNLVVTVNREFGSCGRQIAEKLAQELGFTFYDKNIMEMAAKSSNLPEAFIEAKEQKLTNSLLHTLAAQTYSYPHEQSPLDKLYEAEKDAIRTLAAKGNCVIVGRCADYILKDFPNCYHIFLHADKDFKIQQIMKRESMDYDTAKKLTTEINKKRFIHYRYYTGQVWGLSQHYHLALNTGVLGIDASVATIQSCIQNFIQK
ncbi:MAG: DUF6198 family protein [Lawsonibacter sp.]